jgi:hypothetical protein
MRRASRGRLDKTDDFGERRTLLGAAGWQKKSTAPHPFGALERGQDVMTDSISQKKASTFRMECRVSINIHATPEEIWALLTNAEDFARWNSTVSSIKGSIAQGQKLELCVPISDRTFSPKVTELVPATRMVWSDGMAPMFKGERTFTLKSRADGTTDFEMVEILSGVMLPMIKGSLPDFGPLFDRYALDLKKEAERRAS